MLVKLKVLIKFFFFCKKVFKECDIVICDLYKFGFCFYLVGVICYCDKNLNNFLNFISGVFYYYGSVNFGDYGIEGLKFGVVVSGVFLVNKVSYFGDNY